MVQRQSSSAALARSEKEAAVLTDELYKQIGQQKEALAEFAVTELSNC